MAIPAKKERYTFADILTWGEDERIEIISGEAFMMATPSTRHQEISGALFAQLYNFLEGKKCRVYPAPSGVREYWIVSPEEMTVQVMLRAGGGILQLHEIYGREDIARVNVLEGCFIDLGRVFAE